MQLTQQDCVQNKSDDIGEIEFYTIFNKHYDKLNDIHKSIINDKICTDMTQKDMGDKYSLSQAHISRIYNKFLNNIYSDLYGKRG